MVESHPPWEKFNRKERKVTRMRRHPPPMGSANLCVLCGYCFLPAAFHRLGDIAGFFQPIDERVVDQIGGFELCHFRINP